jgi:methionyl-tRNA formyltransferase
MKAKTLFIGAGNFAVEILKGLQQSANVELVGIITQPDKPAGRKKILTPCHVKEYINDSKLSENYPVFQPEKIKLAAAEILQQTQPELIIVADYGQILPRSIIDYPKYKCLNVHGSLLPDLRGAVPSPMAILKGYKVTGVSIPIMTPGLDDGAVIASQEVEIYDDDTTTTLRARLAKVGAALLNSVLEDWLAGKIKPVEQDATKATLTWQSDIAKEKAQILPQNSIIELDRMVRAFQPWPEAWGIFTNGNQSKRIKIIKLASLKNKTNLDKTNGLWRIAKSLFFVLHGEAIEIESLQVEGSKELKGSEALFLDGFSIK